jgi:hypothetical protein
MSLLITVVGIMVRRLQIYEASARVVVISTWGIRVASDYARLSDAIRI